jgi:hypothetical protein
LAGQLAGGGDGQGLDRDPHGAVGGRGGALLELPASSRRV